MIYDYLSMHNLTNYYLEGGNVNVANLVLYYKNEHIIYENIYKLSFN